jgi:hypothetical protein
MPDPRPDPPSNAPFPTTRWSRVRAAGDRADPEAAEALAELCLALFVPWPYSCLALFVFRERPS